MSTESQIVREVNRRRTFAIISHPDAGKTTITEKILLFGGAINMAGTVKARKSKKFATSDWMEIEKQRGISVTSSVMKFTYQHFEINLLDTPGHQDFSEDTYRVLTAVDSALMLIDGAKGVEAQTKKLLDVCRMRNTPVMTFMNKFDRECRNPFDLLDEVESVLKIQSSPLTWPIGMGREFKGVYDLAAKAIRIFHPDVNQREFEIVKLENLDDPRLEEIAGEMNADQLREDMELLEGAGTIFSKEAYLTGEITPVFFGSALNSFGVHEFLDSFLEYSPLPKSRQATERVVEPTEKNLTGFIFKIQANMDPAHRDRIAFMRICSGKFTRGMKIFHTRLQRMIKLNNTVTFMAKEREMMEEGYAGDILGLYDPGIFKIGDSFSMGEELNFVGIPHFSPENFMRVRLADPLKGKQLEKGLIQLTEEGATQVFKAVASNDHILGVVGSLQFEVIKFRLLHEYNVDGVFEGVPYTCARWYHSHDEDLLKRFEARYLGQIATDVEDKKIFLCNSTWDLDYATKKFEGVAFFQNSDHLPV
ncbi:MAG: peptide chain release factor 3 [SAR324 cluster bacterium]|nr:peptide chain release factor 3 [SAR324 cluster bacterium]